jgi:hypothetical protein
LIQENRVEVVAMQWDLGFTGLALLAGMSLGFGLIAQFVASRTTTRWGPWRP